jgi:hypothetical protein
MKTSAKLIAIVLGLSVSVIASAQQASTAKPNLLTNPSFEEGQTGWEFASKRGQVTVDPTEKHQGKNSIRIENPAGEDTFLKQTITVKPKTRYRMTGYIKTKDVVGKGAGATLALEGGYEATKPVVGNKSWTQVSFEFDSGAVDSVIVGVRLGFYSAPVMGTAWFDELSLVELGPSRKR